MVNMMGGHCKTFLCAMSLWGPGESANEWVPWGGKVLKRDTGIPHPPPHHHPHPQSWMIEGAAAGPEVVAEADAIPPLLATYPYCMPVGRGEWERYIRNTVKTGQQTVAGIEIRH